MGTLHANTPREALSRLESMITMGGFSLPPKTIREIIVAAVDVVIQAARLRDGSRRITQITEVLGLEGETIITQDLLTSTKSQGEDQNGRIIGRHNGHRRRPSPLLGARALFRPRKGIGARARRSGKERVMDRCSFIAVLAFVAVGGVGCVFAGQSAGQPATKRVKAVAGREACDRRNRPPKRPTLKRKQSTPKRSRICANGKSNRASAVLSIKGQIAQAGFDIRRSVFWIASGRVRRALSASPA